MLNRSMGGEDVGFQNQQSPAGSRGLKRGRVRVGGKKPSFTTRVIADLLELQFTSCDYKEYDRANRDVTLW